MPLKPSITPRPRSISRSRRRLARLTRRGLAVATLLATFGPAAQAGVIADWIADRTAPRAMNDPDSDGKTDKTLISRWLSGERTPFSSTGSMGDSSVYLGQKGWEKTKSAPDPISEAEYTAAKKLFDKGDYKGAEKILAALAKREVKKGSPWGEKAQYWLAEVQFRQQKYVAANDNYELLIKKYPGTEYIDKLVAREYQIAQLWLSGEDPKAKPMDWKSHFDGRQPFLDTTGYAVKALDHVRLHDPQGPLADDAALRTADHFHTVHDYESAAVYYDQLIVEHPKSEYKERAMLSSIDAKMKGYIGPEYDISGLEQARETIQKTVQEFPEHLDTAKGLYHTLDLIRDQEAERAYTTGLYYVRARKPISAEYQFGLVMAKWPNSKWAGEAKKEIAKVATMPRKASMPSKIMTAPGAPDASTMGGMGGNNGQAGGAMSGLMNGMGGGGMGGGGMGGMGGMN
jgi:outer membrane protein assembly factor BamD (BamD/ComL family)